MAKIVIDDLDDAVSRRFEAIARNEGKSTNELAREIIDRYASMRRQDAIRIQDEIRQSTVGRRVVDPVQSIREDRDRDHGS